MRTDPGTPLRFVFAVGLSLVLGPSPAFADTAVDVSTPDAAPTNGALSGDVLLRFEGSANPPTRVLQDLIDASAVTGFERLLGSWPVYRALAAGVDPTGLARLLAARSDVEWADAERFFEAHPDEPPIDDPMWDELWHLENVGFYSGSRPQADAHAVPAWQHSTGAGVIIAVLDTGVDMDHPDLRVLPEGYDAFDRDGIPEPDLDSEGSPGHGTAVAGIAAAVGNNGIGVAGVAYDAAIYAVRLIGGPGLRDGDMYNAFVAAVDAGADVMNNSWGSLDSECSPVPERPALNLMVEYARIEGRDGLGTVVVFSAGNSGCEVTQYPLQTNPGVISVGSLRDDDVKFPYSVWGDLLDIMAPSGTGNRQGLRTTDIFGEGGYDDRGENLEYTDRFGGTSGAAPVVSGVVALMIGANPRLTEADVRRVLCATAVRVNPEAARYDSNGWSPTYGCGRVDAGAAVAAVVNGAPGAPQIVRPTPEGDQRTGNVGLQWTAPVDPDGDTLRYEVEIIDLLAPEDDDDDDDDDDSGDDDDDSGDDDDSAESDRVRSWIGLEDAQLDLSADLMPGEYSAQVWALDTWGRGEASEVVSFFVVSPPPLPPPVEEEEGDGCTCSSTASPTASLLVLALCAGVKSRRRSRS
jgi:subtilisin family serine protease